MSTGIGQSKVARESVRGPSALPASVLPLILLLGILLSPGASVALASPVSPADDPVVEAGEETTGSWIVATRATHKTTRIARRFGAVESREAAGLYLVPAASATAFIDALRLGGLLRYAEPDVAPTNRAYPDGTPSAEEWWLDEIVNTKEATPPRVTAKSPRLAIVTPGIDTRHPALKGNLIPGAESTGVTGDREGTALAGIAAASGGDQGFVGVWPGMNLRHAPSGSGRCLEAAEAVRKAARRGTRVIVMGYGFPPGTCRTHLAATQYAVHKGAVLVAASGDDGSKELGRPAGDPHVLSVGSIDRDLRHSAFSNSGARLDLVAPGESVRAPWLKESGRPTPEFSYQDVSGTRYPAAMVGAAAAWLIQVRGELRASQIRSVLEAGARPLGSGERDELFGSGLLSIEGALGATAPTTDRFEPNDDIGWVNGTLLRDGKRGITAKAIWPAPGKKVNAFQATLSGDDPADVYRIRIPGRSRVEIGVNQAEGDVLAEIRKGGSRTIRSTKGRLDFSDLKFPETEGLRVRNKARGYRLVYLVIKPGRGSSSDEARRYRIKIGTSLRR